MPFFFLFGGEGGEGQANLLNLDWLASAIERALPVMFGCHWLLWHTQPQMCAMIYIFGIWPLWRTQPRLCVGIVQAICWMDICIWYRSEPGWNDM